MANKSSLGKNKSQSNAELNDEPVKKVKQEQGEKQWKRKRNRRNKFLKNVKGFGKKGSYGHGSQLETEEFNYFSNILTSLNESNGLDDKTAMANNVIEQTEAKELHLSANQVVSKVIEALIGFTDEENFERFMNVFSEDLRPICSDRFASHVLQKIIEISFLRIASGDSKEIEDGPPKKKHKFLNVPTEKDFNLEDKFSKSHREKCEEFLLKMSKFLMNNLEDFYLDVYANHLIRTTLLALGGFYSQKTIQDPKKKIDLRSNLIPSNIQIIKTPKTEWQEILEEYASRLQLWPHFADLPYHKLSSALLGNLFYAISHTNKKFSNKFGIKILTNCLNIASIETKSEDIKSEEDEEEKSVEDEDVDQKNNSVDGENVVVAQKKKIYENFPKVFQQEPSCCLLETMLLNCDYKLFSKCYAKLFRERIVELSKYGLSNYAVQKLLDKIEISEFDEVFDPLSEKIKYLLKIGHTGVVYSLANACLRLQTKQGAFCKALNTALKAKKDDSENSADLFLLVLKLRGEQLPEAKESNFVHLHGSLIIQTILKYNKPIQMVNSILAQPGEKLASIFQNPLGSYCAEAFCESSFIGEKSKEKLVKSLEGNYLSLATNKCGSRVLETFFKNCGPAQKEKIVKELSSRINQLKGSIYGRFIHKNLNVEVYKMSPSAWKASLAKLST